MLVGEGGEAFPEESAGLRDAYVDMAEDLVMVLFREEPVADRPGEMCSLRCERLRLHGVS